MYYKYSDCYLNLKQEAEIRQDEEKRQVTNKIPHFFFFTWCSRQNEMHFGQRPQMITQLILISLIHEYLLTGFLYSQAWEVIKSEDFQVAPHSFLHI